MNQQKLTEEEILAFEIPDEALEGAASANFSLRHCTDARVCPVDG